MVARPEFINDEYREGYSAFCSGVNSYDNPYDEIDEEAEHDDWCEGWLDAELDLFQLVGVSTS